MTRDYLKEMQDHYAQVVSAGTGEKKKIEISFCPTTWNQPCKLCDHCKEILFHQDSHTKEEIDAAREINRKPKFYANVVLATNPSELLLFEYGKTIGDKLGVYEMDGSSELKGFSHPTTGRNIFIVRYPHPDKRKTRYDVEPKMSTSPLIDRSVLNKLYNLDEVAQLIRSNAAVMLYQSKLTAQRTEIRWLPSWLGQKFASVFQVKYFIHYHISEDELAAINRGEFNPLAENKIVVPEPVITIQPSPPTMGTSTSAKNLWDEEDVVEAPAPVQTPKTVKPGCIGTYDANDPLCAQRCATNGVLEECKKETEYQMASLIKRQKARGLTQYK